MTRWTHLHTLAGGLVLGLAFGVVIVLGARYARRAVSFAREQAARVTTARAEAHAAKTELDLAEAERKRAAAAEAVARAERYVRTAKEQEKALDHAYRMGAADDERHRESWLAGERGSS